MSAAATNELIAYVTGIGVRGPGLADWPQTEAVFCARQPYQRADTLLPAPDTLPPTERRRTGRDACDDNRGRALALWPSGPDRVGKHTFTVHHDVDRCPHGPSP